MTIRPAAIADLKSLLHLHRSVFGAAAFNAYVLRQQLDAFADLQWVAEDSDGNLAGCISGAIEQPTGSGWIWALAVHPEYRGQRLGERLSRQLLATLAEYGSEHVRLTVSPGNRAAIRLYERLGFEQQEVVTDYFGAGEDRIIMLHEMSK